jgi:hypothetical protein
MREVNGTVIPPPLVFPDPIVQLDRPADTCIQPLFIGNMHAQLSGVPTKSMFARL